MHNNLILPLAFLHVILLSTSTSLWLSSGMCGCWELFITFNLSSCNSLSYSSLRRGRESEETERKEIRSEIVTSALRCSIESCLEESKKDIWESSLNKERRESMILSRHHICQETNVKRKGSQIKFIREAFSFDMKKIESDKSHYNMFR